MELAPEIQRRVEGLEPTSERPPITERCLRDLGRDCPDPDYQLVELKRITGVALERDADREAFAAGRAQVSESAIRYRFGNIYRIWNMDAEPAIRY